MSILTQFAVENKTLSHARATVATRIKLACVALALAFAVTAAPMIASTMIDGEIRGLNHIHAEDCSDTTSC